MGRVLVIPDGNFLSHTSRPLEIAKVLSTLGHEVTFAGEGQYMKLASSAGFQVLPLKTNDPSTAGGGREDYQSAQVSGDSWSIPAHSAGIRWATARGTTDTRLLERKTDCDHIGGTRICKLGLGRSM